MNFKFKDSETPKIKYRKLYTIGAIFILQHAIFDIVLNRYNFMDFINIGLAIFLLGGIWKGWLYKIMRWIAVYYLKKRDNKFDPYRLR